MMEALLMLFLLAFIEQMTFTSTEPKHHKSLCSCIRGFASITQQNAAADENVGVAGRFANGGGGQGTMWWQGGKSNLTGRHVIAG